MSKSYQEWIQSRKITSIDQLPTRYQDRLYEFIEVYCPDKIYLVGSFAEGDWIDEDTPQYYRDKKKQIKYKDKVSDLDIVVEPDPGIIFYEELHINPIKDERVLLYSKTKNDNA